MSVLRCVRAADVAAGVREDAAAVDVMCVLMLVRSVGGDERNAAASSILESIKRLPVMEVSSLEDTQRGQVDMVRRV